MNKKPTVQVCPVMEAIAKKLLGINGVPVTEQAKMIKRAVKAGADAAKKISQEQAIRAFLAFTGSDFRVKIELSELKTYITTGQNRYELGWVIQKFQESR